MEKKERQELLKRIEKEISELKELGDMVSGIIEKLESQAKRLRYQQTLTAEE